MLPQKTVTFAILDAIGDVFNYFFNDDKPEPEPELKLSKIKKTKKPTKDRKHPDYRPFTKIDYDIIMKEFNAMTDRNAIRPKGQKKETHNDLVILLNERLKYDKSRTTYSQVWRNKIKRSDLYLGY